MILDYLREILPLIEKAAPLIAYIVKNEDVQIIAGLLGAIFNHDPTDEEGLTKKMSEDDDLYTKLYNLDSTHRKWLGSF